MVLGFRSHLERNRSGLLSGPDGDVGLPDVLFVVVKILHYTMVETRLFLQNIEFYSCSLVSFVLLKDPQRLR